MAPGVVVAREERAEFPFPTPPASDEGDKRGKRDGDARYGGGSSDDDGCEGCRKIKQDEVWRFQRQRKGIGEWNPFSFVRVGACGCGVSVPAPVPASAWFAWRLPSLPSLPTCLSRSQCGLLQPKSTPPFFQSFQRGTGYSPSHPTTHNGSLETA